MDVRTLSSENVHMNLRVATTSSSNGRIFDPGERARTLDPAATTREAPSPNELARLLGSVPVPPLPKPQLISCVIFDAPRVETKVERADAGTVTSFDTRTYVVPPRRDPFYLELANVPTGAKVEVLNLSTRPDAEFDTHGFVLEPCGWAEDGDTIEDMGAKFGGAKERQGMSDPRAGKRGVAGFFLGPEGIAKHELAMHGKLLVRVVDASGRRSDPLEVTVSGTPEDLPFAVRIPDVLDKDVKYASDTTARTISRLDSDRRNDGSTLVTRTDTMRTDTHYTKTTTTRQLTCPAWKASFMIAGGTAYPLIAAKSWDSQKPVIVEKGIALGVKNGAIVLRMDKAAEPDATVYLRNPRTGGETKGRVKWDRTLELPLPEGTATSDVLKLTVWDTTKEEKSAYNSRTSYAVVDPTFAGGLRWDPAIGALADASIPAEVKPAAIR